VSLFINNKFLVSHLFLNNNTEDIRPILLLFICGTNQ
jgi:hypothetical protein